MLITCCRRLQPRDGLPVPVGQQPVRVLQTAGCRLQTAGQCWERLPVSGSYRVSAACMRCRDGCTHRDSALRLETMIVIIKFGSSALTKEGATSSGAMVAGWAHVPSTHRQPCAAPWYKSTVTVAATVEVTGSRGLVCTANRSAQDPAQTFRSHQASRNGCPQTPR